MQESYDALTPDRIGRLIHSVSVEDARPVWKLVVAMHVSNICMMQYECFKFQYVLLVFVAPIDIFCENELRPHLS